MTGALSMSHLTGIKESKMKLEDAEKIIEGFEELQEMAAPIAADMLSLELDHPCAVDPEEITVDGGQLYVNYEEYFGCGNYENHSRVIPLEYLFDPEWEKKAKIELARRHEEKMEKKRLAKEKAKRAKEDRERREYLKLQLKYGEK